MKALPHRIEASACEPAAAAPAAAPVPHFVIEAGRGSLWDALGELWQHRELLYFLAWRDVKLRYKQTALGALWAVLQPLLMMVVFTLLFGKLAHVPSDGLPYPIFAFAGLVPWQFFQTAVSQGGASVIGNAQLITKVYFPRMAIPGAAVGAALVDFAIASIILFAMMVCYGIAPGAGIAMFPVLVALLAIFAGAVGMWMAGMNVKYRDIKYVLPFMLQLWMFATPVIYPSSFVPASWRWILDAQSADRDHRRFSRGRPGQAFRLARDGGRRGAYAGKCGLRGMVVQAHGAQFRRRHLTLAASKLCSR